MALWESPQYIKKQNVVQLSTRLQSLQNCSYLDRLVNSEELCKAELYQKLDKVRIKAFEELNILLKNP